jgi:hypothetical protein
MSAASSTKENKEMKTEVKGEGKESKTMMFKVGRCPRFVSLGSRGCVVTNACALVTRWR